MKAITLVPLLVGLLCGCAPDSGGPASAAAEPHADGSPPSASVVGGMAESPEDNSPSYEVSIASAEAERVRARDLCDSGDKAQRRSCLEAADAAYDQAKSAAESGHNNVP